MERVLRGAHPEHPRHGELLRTLEALLGPGTPAADVVYWPRTW
ncbi:hypothetical protein ACFQY4_04170 [Catellatospora bangladeshensis]